jgi:hypothetical protein
VLLNLIFVEHPGQFNVPVGAIRFDLSLRGVGERLVSSITSRTGLFARGGTIVLDPTSMQAILPR